MDLRYLVPGVSIDEGNIRLKFLGLEFLFYWPSPDWGFGISAGFFGRGFHLARHYFFTWHEGYDDFWGGEEAQ